MTEYAFEGPKRASTSVTWSFETTTYPSDATTPFSSPILAQYQATIEAAFNRWASVSGLSFSEVSDTADSGIRIGFGVFASSSEIGETRVLSRNGTLTNDTIIRLLDPRISPLTLVNGTWTYTQLNATLYQVAVHEIGHALGLDHPSDSTQVMASVATSANRDLGYGDIEGIDTLYPLYTVTAANALQEVSASTTNYQFTVTRNGDFSLPVTLNWSVVGAPYPGLGGTVAATGADFVGGVLPSGQISFAPGAATATVTVSVAGASMPEPERGFALVLADRAAGALATVRGSLYAAVLNHVATAVTAQTVSVFRFFDKSDGTHFFTASATERNNLVLTRPDLTYEGVGLQGVADPTSDPNAIPVYRFFDTANGTHFYSASATERDSVIATRPDLTFEGIGFYEDAAPAAGNTPVYRFFDTTNGTHFYTASATERATILQTRSDLRNEGIGFYAPTTAA